MYYRQEMECFMERGLFMQLLDVHKQTQSQAIIPELLNRGV